jgi:hypothetical protein
MHAGKTRRAGATRLVVTYNINLTFLRHPPSESASARANRRVITPPLHVPIYTVLGVSLTYLEPSKLSAHPLDTVAFRSKLQGSELRNMVRAWTSTHT